MAASSPLHRRPNNASLPNLLRLVRCPAGTLCLAEGEDVMDDLDLVGLFLAGMTLCATALCFEKPLPRWTLALAGMALMLTSGGIKLQQTWSIL